MYIIITTLEKAASAWNIWQKVGIVLNMIQRTVQAEVLACVAVLTRQLKVLVIIHLKITWCIRM